MAKKPQGIHITLFLLIIILIGLFYFVGYIILSDFQKKPEAGKKSNITTKINHITPTPVPIKTVILEAQNNSLLPPKIIVKKGEKTQLKFFIHDEPYGILIKDLSIEIDETEKESEAILFPKSKGNFQIIVTKNGNEIKNMTSTLVVED